MTNMDMPLEAFLERFLSNVRIYSRSCAKADLPDQSVYEVIGDYQQAWLEGESVKRFSKDFRDLTGSEVKVLMQSEDYRAIETRGNVWIEKHSEQIFNFM